MIAAGRSMSMDEARYLGGCIAMSRFLVFVWMEAEYQKHEADGHPLALRTWPLVDMLTEGRLRLTWSDS